MQLEKILVNSYLIIHLSVLKRTTPSFPAWDVFRDIFNATKYQMIGTYYQNITIPVILDLINKRTIAPKIMLNKIFLKC